MENLKRELSGFMQEMIKHIDERFLTLENIIRESHKPFKDMNEAACYLSIPKTTLNALTSKKAIGFYKNGKKIYFKTEELDAFVLNNKYRCPSYEESQRSKWKTYSRN